MTKSRKPAMRKKQVIIVDVNNLLHIGNHRFRNYSVTDMSGNKIKTGGMFMVLNLLRRVIYSPTEDLWFFCFDRSSHRKEVGYSVGIEYKSNRERMPSHLKVQADELYKWLPQMGYNALAVDGLEADDLINSLVSATKHLDVKFNIISTDRDLAFNVSEKVDLISSNSKVPSVTKENYEQVVGKNGQTVYYNSILLYKIICGDKVDGIPPITAESYALYKRLCNKLISDGFDMSTLSDFNVIENLVKQFPEEYRIKAEDNWQLIKPFILPVAQIPVKNLQINLDKIKEFCAIFGMKSIAGKFGLELDEYPEHIMEYRAELYRRTIELDNSLGVSSLTEDFDEVIENETLTGKERIEEIEKIKASLEELDCIKLVKNDELVGNNISINPLSEN